MGFDPMGQGWGGVPMADQFWVRDRHKHEAAYIAVIHRMNCTGYLDFLLMIMTAITKLKQLINRRM